MALFRLLNYSIAHVCLMCSLLAFTKWRYSAKKTIGVAVGVTAVLFLLEWVRYVNMGLESMQSTAYFFQTVLILGTSVYLSQYRDFRGLFTGFSSRIYVQSGTLIARGLYVFTDHLAFSVSVGAILNIIFLIVLIRYLRPHYMGYQLVNRKEWFWLCLVPGVFSLLRVVLRDFLVEAEPKEIISALFLVMTLYVSYVLLFRLVGKCAKEERIQRERDVLESSIKALKRTMEEIHVVEQKRAIQEHDRRHLIRMMQGLIAKEDYDSVKGLLNQFLESPESQVESYFCDNPPINGLVSMCVTAAKEKQIQTYMELDIPEKLPVNEWELAVVIGNLLENAIEAASDGKAEEGRMIWMTARQIRGQMLIEVLNTFGGTPVFDEETLLPISSRGEGRGFGLPSVVGFTERSGATFDCGIEDNRFFARLLI